MSVGPKQSGSWDLEALRNQLRLSERQRADELKEDLDGFVDVHCHILPGVDDGAASFADSVDLLRSAHEGGTRTLVATPHLYHPSFDGVDAQALREAFRAWTARLAEVAERDGYEWLGELRLSLGAEHRVDDAFFRALRRDEVIPLGSESRCLLIEFPDALPETAILNAVDKVLENGHQPVLAHVERVEVFRRSPAVLERLLALGAVAQVNLHSLFDAADDTARRHVLGRRAVVIASDGHHVTRRPIHLGRLGEFEGQLRLRALVEEGVTTQARRLLSSSSSSEEGSVVEIGADAASA